ncbi:MAG: glycosyltransferase [Nanoarchaeota archaeon]|nr:glycosyltransferase [Nanoarchaeota archaeon]
MKEEKNLLVTLADKNYIDKAKALFSSVYFNASWKGDYMLLSYDIPEKDLKWFRDKGILICKRKPIKIRKGNWPMSGLNKFYLFTPDFKRWNHIIYLDSDTLVRASLNKLTKIRGFGVVEDPLKLRDQLKTHINPRTLMKLNKTFNLRAGSFNSGVMAFSTDIIKERTFIELLKINKQYDSLRRFADQTILNLYFYKRWKKLSKNYNLNPENYIHKPNNKMEYFRNTVLHFYGSIKPWDKKSQYKDEWRGNLKKADSINLNNRPYKRMSITNVKHHYYFIRMQGLIILNGIVKEINPFIGLIGIKIKKISPKAYLILKKLFPNKK